jgi:hypothetical protein
MYKSYKKPFLNIITSWGKKIHDKNFNKPPIYLGGCGRSGTTLLLSILSSHPEIFACKKELKLFKEVTRGESGEIIPKRMDRLYRSLITHKVAETCNRWCEKTPRNVRHIQEISSYHNGNYKFLNIVRDGRDVILSQHPNSPETYWVNPERWINDVSAAYEERNNPNVYTVRYEDMILDFDQAIEKICAFLDIPKCDEIENWHLHTTVRKNNAYFGDVQRIFKGSIEKWKKPKNKDRAEELMKYDEAKKLLSFYGYEV